MIWTNHDDATVVVMTKTLIELFNPFVVDDTFICSSAL